MFCFFFLESTRNLVVHIGEKVSHCQREFKAVASKVELDLVNIMPNMQHSPLPPSRMMALNIVTVACPKTNKPQVWLSFVYIFNTIILDCFDYGTSVFNLLS